MFELRILSGLHRGATLPLDDQPHLIGASDEADVVLVDGCINEQHATLTQTDTGWILTAENGVLFNADSSKPQAFVDLAPGDFARLGDVWVMIVQEGAEWQSPPPLPVDDLFEPGLEDDGPAINAAEMDAPTDENPSSDDAEPAAELTEVEPLREKSNRKLLLIPFAAMVVLSAAAAYAMTAKNTADTTSRRLDLKMSDAISTVKPAEPYPESAAGGSNLKRQKAALSARALSPQELQSAFRKRLADADLIKRFDIKLEDNAWNMQGDLTDEETKRFERILQAFVKEHKITFPVNAKVVSAEGMLPFKIRQVITGANASIVTQDGQRLYVGEEYEGIRVVAIQDNHLTFGGKRKIEMNW